ncbi:23S rRNA (adenine(2503)-C(2))-methyltransferase RlmN [Clostridium algidicarnis]|uniref:23S rRNA (adenine(2503)-C(2))-methyltransferase RlmN n=1 Tax=Clostridium algidicarnis TaxID=37659 RepID=UPI001CF2F517|nr:23S rRNA (adenine(2503)-C(2))-methyltransferase RlmN [Clostridium algidicarnis]MCB2285587.1 23S rRNA (adenine(2503)-C(2))-methyltransferase RlmN [Clostridium algidicarnis]
MKNILDLSLEELKIWMKENKESEFRAKQVMDWIYKGIFEFNLMSNLSKPLREKLKSHFLIYIPLVVNSFQSKKDNTKKLLLALEDNNLIECVIMDYKYGKSICISTQVGCRMGCKFCASTVDGVIRSLSAGEMISQILAAEKLNGDRISNVVLMGSGEPFDNYDNVIKFLKIVNAEYGLNIGQRHITLSTCGIVPKINEMAKENMQITLAISLHASNDEDRKKIMPIANKYSIEEIINACKDYIGKTGRRITFEYALVNEINDSKENAIELSNLLKGILCHVNLIPVNEIKEKVYVKSSEENIKKFADILNKRGIDTTVRREMGSDIDAACGQLRRSHIEKTQISKKGC